MKRSLATTLLLIGFAAMMALPGCGGGSAGNPQPPPVINANAQPPAGAVGAAYTGFTFTATGGVPPLTWSETGGLPPGLMFSSGGLLSGTPTSAGSFLITVMVQDSLGQNATPQDFTIEVALSGQVSGFTPTGSMGTARESHTATLLNTGKVLVTGGVDSNKNTLATAELFDPASGAFTPTGSMGTARESHTATLRNDGTVLVSGGATLVTAAVCGNNCVTQVPLSLATAELFDPASGTFAATGSMETPRAGQTATLLNDGKVLVTGGVHSTVLGRQFVSTVLSTAELFQ